MQLGSYDRPEILAENWAALKVRTPLLSDYEALKSRAEVEGRLYYRLSVGRFETSQDARRLCGALKDEGASCFIREGKFRG